MLFIRQSANTTIELFKQGIVLNNIRENPKSPYWFFYHFNKDYKTPFCLCLLYSQLFAGNNIVVFCLPLIYVCVSVRAALCINLQQQQIEADQKYTQRLCMRNVSRVQRETEREIKHTAVRTLCPQHTSHRCTKLGLCSLQK